MTTEGKSEFNHRLYWSQVPGSEGSQGSRGIAGIVLEPRSGLGSRRNDNVFETCIHA